jgi:hypothetical protein
LRNGSGTFAADETILDDYPTNMQLKVALRPRAMLCRSLDGARSNGQSEGSYQRPLLLPIGHLRRPMALRVSGAEWTQPK